jgi:hypothetical protein
MYKCYFHAIWPLRRKIFVANVSHWRGDDNIVLVYVSDQRESILIDTQSSWWNLCIFHQSINLLRYIDYSVRTYKYKQLNKIYACGCTLYQLLVILAIKQQELNIFLTQKIWNIHQQPIHSMPLAPWVE